MKEIDEMPIVKSVIEYKEKKTIPLHMPGHKRGQSFLSMDMDFPWLEALQYDTTEVDFIDNLHSPDGAIKEAEKKAAKLFRADETYFLVNGTTAGILAMIHCVTQPGDSIIIPRNCHKSVMNSVILGHLKPIYLLPEIEGIYEVAMGISPESVELALLNNPEAKAVVITSPTYYGVCSDLEKIAEIVHKSGKILLVDEAHGAHFCFSELCPKSAIECGADAVAQSTHKCLSAFTGTSMLHLKGNKIDREKLKFYLQAYQTSSPNHILLAGLDGARYQMEKKEGRAMLDTVIKWSIEAKRRINQIHGLSAIDSDFVGTAAAAGIDPTRVVVSVRKLGITGMFAENFLRENFNIQLEMADLYNIVAIFTIGDLEESFDGFILGLEELSSTYSASGENASERLLPEEGLPKMVIPPWEAVLGGKKSLKFEDSEGFLAAEMIIPYPPGIPVLMPGERITRTNVEYIKMCLTNGIKVNSSFGNKQGFISVVDSRKDVAK